MIVKVQVPLVTTERGKLALVYNEDRSVQFQMPVTPELVLKMEGRPKVFFHAEIVEAKNERSLGIHEEAPWQSW